MTTVVKDGYVRRVFDDYVQWFPAAWNNRPGTLPYCVTRIPFVPGYHLCSFEQGEIYVYTRILSTHKTLHEALDIAKVIGGGCE